MAHAFDFNRFMDEFADTRKQAAVDAVFGTPIESEGRIVIPIASTLFGFGLGLGVSESQAQTADDAGASNMGGGGGGGYITRPMAVAVIDRDNVRIEPVVNQERIALGGMLMVAWVAFWGVRLMMKLIGVLKR